MDKTPINEKWLRATEDSLENQRLLPTHEQSKLQLECLERKRKRKDDREKRKLAKLANHRFKSGESKTIYINLSSADLKKFQLVVDYLTERYGIDTKRGAIRFCIGDFIERNKLKKKEDK
jgi:hypothetical protein